MSVTPGPSVAIIVVAAGDGTRLAAGAPKAFVGIDGHSVLWHALRGVFAVRRPMQVVVVAPADRVGAALTEARAVAGERRELVTVVAGGVTRQASVAAGLHALLPSVEVVLVHDAARALTPVAVIERVAEAVDRTGWGIVPVLPVVDTIKRVEGERITGVVDRSRIGAAQTPQGFHRGALVSAYAAAAEEYTDDAALMQAAGHPVGTVDGDQLGFKITTPVDLDRARAVVAGASATRETAAAAAVGIGSPGGGVPGPATTAAGEATGAGHAAPRVGVGTDVHAFSGEGTLRLAGLEWPGEPALAGHSDGDAVAHAMVDALLSAAGLGDIGQRFGTDRPELAGAHAEVFLRETRALLSASGWRIGNVSVQLQAARPRFAARRAEAEAALSAALGAPVAVSATTTDGLGFTGRGEGVQAFAVALLLPA